MMRNVFSEIINQENMTPESWKKVVIKVIFNMGDATRPENHRPTCTLFIVARSVFDTAFQVGFAAISIDFTLKLGGIPRNF